MIMKNPPHPGSVVLRECIEPLGLTITEAAQALGVTRNTLSELVNGNRQAVQGFRGQRGELACATGPVRPCPSPPRPHKTETAGTRLTSH